VSDGQLAQNYDEKIVANYMKNEHIELVIEISTGIKNFTAYTMDFTNKYIEINSDYRS
jgi:glutamate N-acetyltransferase/amino-acid N-acetyltransferase